MLFWKLLIFPPYPRLWALGNRSLYGQSPNFRRTGIQEYHWGHWVNWWVIYYEVSTFGWPSPDCRTHYHRCLRIAAEQKLLRCLIWTVSSPRQPGIFCKWKQGWEYLSELYLNRILVKDKLHEISVLKNKDLDVCEVGLGRIRRVGSFDFDFKVSVRVFPIALVCLQHARAGKKRVFSKKGKKCLWYHLGSTKNPETPSSRTRSVFGRWKVTLSRV